jgi:predicted dehydrogenase
MTTRSRQTRPPRDTLRRGKATDAATAATAAHGIKNVFGTIAGLASHPGVDLVGVLTTTPKHEEGIRATIAGGRSVYCEYLVATLMNMSKDLVH